MRVAIISSHRIERGVAWETDIAKMIYVPYPIALKETGVTIIQQTKKVLNTNKSVAAVA
jgi:hypothetical protein